MALTFPILSLNPSSFSMEPINKSLVPEDVASLYASGRELYIGNPYTIDIKYTNLSASDFVKLYTFCELVGTLLPFKFMFEQYVYNANFTKPYQISKQNYNLFNVSFQMKTFVASLENWINLETNLAKRWFYLTDYPYSIVEGTDNYIMRSVYETIDTTMYINGEGILVTYTPPQPPAILYCATQADTAIQFTIGAVYVLTTKLTLYSGQAPYIGVWTGVGYVFEFGTPTLQPGYQVIEFTATSVNGFIIVGNDQASEWSLETELIMKVV